MKVTVVSPESILFKGEAQSVFVPGTSGQFEILENHAPIISSLEKGEVRVCTSEGEETYQIAGGFVEVADNDIDICAEVEE